jgi:hypothetical protein
MKTQAGPIPERRARDGDHVELIDISVDTMDEL